MQGQSTNENKDFISKSSSSLINAPLYDSEMGNESGINYKTVEIKSHSFSVRTPRNLAAENIIFEPGTFDIEEEQ